MLNLRVVIFIIVSLFFVGCGVIETTKVTSTPTKIQTPLPSLPFRVNITSPQDDSDVTSPVDISFTVTGDIPGGFKPVVVIRDPLGQLWPWLHVQNQGGGNWLLPGLTLGNASDCGKSFGLHVVITNETVPPSKIPALPGGENHSVMVTKTCK